MKISRYVGIDPSSNTGFYIQDEDGNCLLEEEVFYKYKKDPERIAYICDYLISKINKETDLVCIEGFSYNSKGRAMGFQFGLGWSIRYLLLKNDIKYYEVTPGLLKKFATGKGSINKKDMIQPIKEKFNYYHASDNITDAFILSEICRNLKNYDNKNYDKDDRKILKMIVEGNMNTYNLEETPLPKWMNKKSKYYFERN